METSEQLARKAILSLLDSQGFMSIDSIDRYCFHGFADRKRLFSLIKLMRDEYLIVKTSNDCWKITDAGNMYLERER